MLSHYKPLQAIIFHMSGDLGLILEFKPIQICHILQCTCIYKINTLRSLQINTAQICQKKKKKLKRPNALLWKLNYRLFNYYNLL